MGEFFLVIMMCIGTACQTIHNEVPFETYDSCYQTSVVVASEYNKKYTNSRGQCYCLTKDQYETYLNNTTEQDRSILGDEPKIGKQTGMPI